MKQLRILPTVFSSRIYKLSGLKPYKNKEIPLSTQNIHVNHPSIFDKYFYFLDKYTCQKKRESVTMILVERGEVSYGEPYGFFLSLF